jgi:uncharacterized protein (DUF1684 family)
MKRRACDTNRKRTLAVFRFSSCAALAALLAASGCGRHAAPQPKENPLLNESLYSLEVRKDRKVKDLSFLRDPQSPLKPEDQERFNGLAYYTPDKSFAFTSVLERLDPPQSIVMATSKDRPREMQFIGRLPFVYQGKEYRLRVYMPKDTSGGAYWFIPFTDATTGGETYGGGRYIDIDHVESDSVVLDFNFAYNPYCAYNDRYDCPIPPAENRIPFAVTAGEKKYPLH